MERMNAQGIKLEYATQTVYKALKNLTVNNVLAFNQGQYSFLYPLMQKTIKEYHYSTLEIDALKRDVNNAG